MYRRQFIYASAGLLASPVFSRAVASERAGKRIKKKYTFKEIQLNGALATITRVTPEDGFYVHTYYDVCPFSRSQRYLAVTRLPYQDRIPVLGDTADVCVIDLEEETIETVYTTKSWGFQTGALVNWGATDRYLYTNDVFDDTSICVRIDLDTLETMAFPGPMYHMAPDESAVIGFPLELLDVTQKGYGVPAKDPDNPQKLSPGASETQGLWKTDLKTRKKVLLASLAEIAGKVSEPAPEKGGTFYLWHSKFNPQGDRIMQVVRCLLPSGRGGRNAMVFTLNADGSDLRCMPATQIWGAAGGHPNWQPDGEHLLRVLKVDGKDRYAEYRHDGSGFKVLSEKLDGGGHPTFERQRKFICTDSFSGANPQNVSILLQNMVSEEEEVVCTMATLPRATAIQHQQHRLDGHPTWDRDYKKVCFQAAPDGARQLYIADLSRLLS